MALKRIDVDKSNLTYTSVDGVLFSKDMTTLLVCPGQAKTAYTIPDCITKIGSWAFADCTGLTTISIPEGITAIEAGTFNGCSNLTSIRLPNSLKTISYWSFIDCSSLTSITIPDSVTSISYFVFPGCDKLTSVTIGSSVESFGVNIWFRCPNIKDVYYNTEHPVEADFGLFSDEVYENATLHVLKPALDEIKTTAPWRRFKNITCE